MIAQRVFPFAIFALVTIGFTACSSAGGGGFNNSQGAAPQSEAVAPQAVGAQQMQSIGAEALRVEDAGPPHVYLPPAMKGVYSPLLTKPIIDDVGSFPGGPIIEGENTSTAGTGMEGIAASTGNGVVGVAESSGSAVYGNGAGTGANGVYGYSKAHYGVVGNSTNYIGVLGETGSASAFGGYFKNSSSSTSAVSLEGVSANGIAVNAVGGAVSGLDSFPALSIVGDAAGGGNPDLIDGCRTGTANPCDRLRSVFSFDAVGDFSVGAEAVGCIAVGGVSCFSDDVDIAGQYLINGSCVAGCAAATNIAAGKAVTRYVPSTSVPTAEDFGEAQLVGGQAYVRLSPDFANIIDQRAKYLVFITPEGDNRGLYATQKSPTGFAVRESEGGHSSVAFSYRIVAKPYGVSAPRLPMVTLMQNRSPLLMSRPPQR